MLWQTVGGLQQRLSDLERRVNSLPANQQQLLNDLANRVSQGHVTLRSHGNDYLLKIEV